MLNQPSQPLQPAAGRRAICRLTLAALFFATWLPAAPPARGTELRRSAIVQAVDRVRDTVVNIHGEKTLGDGEFTPGDVEADRRVNGMGTGAIIDERGYIITNHHVVDGVAVINVTTSNGDEYVAKLISHDPDSDLAIVKIDGPKKFPVTPIGTSHDLMTGETVIAIGNAFGYEHTITRGIISALHRRVQVGDNQKYDDLIQTDASINPGNSGGPLFNIDGDMIGINVAVRVGAQGIGFAIPIDKAMEIACDLMSTRRLSSTWHGIVTECKSGSTDKTIVVRTIDKESPAAMCGLSAGDQIVRVGDMEIVRPIDLERALLGRRAGEEVELVVQREQQPTSVKLTLAELPSHLRPIDEPVWQLLGLRLQPMPTKEFQKLRTRYQGGLRVMEVRSGGPAARQGIRRGDVLVGMHIWETVSLDNVSYILNRPDFASLSPLKFYIVRGSETYLGHMHVTGQRTR